MGPSSRASLHSRCFPRQRPLSRPSLRRPPSLSPSSLDANAIGSSLLRSSMMGWRWFAWWAAGLACGMAFMALFLHLSRRRSLHRTRLATAIVLLSKLTPADTRRLFSKQKAPPWVVFPKQEKVHWLNHEVEKIWPYFGKEACKSLISWVESTLESYKTGILESFKFQTFELGTLPSQFSGVERVKSNNDEIILEFDFQWKGDPEIELEVQTTAGAALPVQINNINFAGRFRLTFKPLADTYPCFKAFTYSIKDLRVFDFYVKGVPGVVYSSSGFLKMVKKFIKTSIVDSLVWPMRQIYQVVPGDYREFELQVSGILRVKVVEARNLLNKDTIGKSDPFTILYIRHIPSRMKRSKTINNNLNPIWNETFRMEVEDLPTQSLFIKVLDDDGLQEADSLGCAKFELKTLEPGELVDIWIPLQQHFDENELKEDNYRGEIHLELCYVCSNEDLLHPLASLTTPRTPLSKQLTTLEKIYSKKDFRVSPSMKTLLDPRSCMEAAVVRGILSVTVLRADELGRKKSKESLNPFVMLKMKKSSALMRTKVVSKSNSPEWNEVFHIVVEDSLHDMLLVEVWNQKLFMKRLIGKCALTVTRLLQISNKDVKVELQEADAGKVHLHIEWRSPAPSDPSVL